MDIGTVALSLAGVAVLLALGNVVVGRLRNPQRVRINHLKNEIGRMIKAGTNPACVAAREAELLELQG